MHNECENIQNRMISDEALSDAEKTHADSCRACSETSQVLKAVAASDIANASPTPETDAAVRDAAHAHLRAGAAPGPMPMQSRQWLPLLSAAAAAIIFVCTAVWITQNKTTESENPGRESVVINDPPGQVIEAVPGNETILIDYGGESLDFELFQLEVELALDAWSVENEDVL